MIYEFKCECGNIQEIECNMGNISSRKIFCEKCGNEMKRIWNSSSFIVPESMKKENEQEMSFVKKALKNRPSGKQKIWY